MFFSNDLLRELPSKFVSISKLMPKSNLEPILPDPEKIYFSMDYSGAIRFSAALLGSNSTCDVQYDETMKVFRVKLGHNLPINIRHGGVSCAEFTRLFNFTEINKGRIRVLVEYNHQDGWYYSKDVPESLFNKK